MFDFMKSMSQMLVVAHNGTAPAIEIHQHHQSPTTNRTTPVIKNSSKKAKKPVTDTFDDSETCTSEVSIDGSI